MAIVVMVGTAFASKGRAATYHVSPSGENTNPGTLKFPFETIDQALAVCNAGDTVLVNDGTYLITRACLLNKTDVSMIAVGGFVVVDGSQIDPFEVPERKTGFSIVAHSCTVDGFTMRNMPTHAIVAGGGSNESSGIKIMNCRIEKAGGAGILASHAPSIQIANNSVKENGNYGIRLSTGCNDAVLDGNYLSKNGEGGVATYAGEGENSRGIVVQNNIIEGNEGFGIQVSNMDESMIINNLCIDNRLGEIQIGSTRHVGLTPSNETGVRGIVIANNTLVSSVNSSGILLSSQSGIGAQECIVFNNLVITLDQNMAIRNNSPTNRIDGNTNLVRTWSETTLDSLFVDFTSGDYRIRPGMAAHGRGVTSFDGIDAPTEDIAGNLRTSRKTVDIGAYKIGDGDPEESFVLDVEVNGSGTITIDPDKPYYAEGERVVITALENTEWSFDGWSGTLTGDENPTVLTVDGDMEIEANFIFRGSDSYLPPSVPTGLSATGSDTGVISVSWSANPEDNLVGYTIYYGKRSVADGDVRAYDYSVSVGLGTGHTIRAPFDGTYYLAMRALDQDRHASDYSPEVRVEVGGADIVADAVSPEIIIGGPLNGATNVSPNTTVFFAVTDGQMGVDSSTLKVEVNGRSPGNVNISGRPSNYAVVCEPREQLPFGSVNVIMVSVNDLASPPNSALVNWAFTTSNDSSFLATETNTKGLRIKGTGEDDARQKALARAIARRTTACQVFDRGDLAGADSLFHEVLETRRGNGAGDADMFESLVDVATTRRARGDYKGAENYFRQALNFVCKPGAAMNIDTVNSLMSLGSVLGGQGNYVAAEPLFRRAHEISALLWPEGHPEVASCLMGLAGILHARGNHVSAGALYAQAYQMRLAWGCGDSEKVECLLALGRLYEDRGDCEGAEIMYREALEISLAVYGDANPHTDLVNALACLAHARKCQEDYAEAEYLYKRALDTARRVWRLPEGSPEVACQLENLGELFRFKKDYAGAETCFKEALDIRRGIRGNLDPNTVHTLTSLGQLHYERREYGEARKYFSDAAQVYERARLMIGYGYSRAHFQPSPYAYLAATLMHLNSSTDAWQAAERARGRALADLVSARSATASPGWERERALVRSVADCGYRLEALLTSSSDTMDDQSILFHKVKNELLVAEKELSALLEEKSRMESVYDDGVIPLSRIQTMLVKHDAIIGWLDIGVGTNKTESWAYVIRNEGEVQWARLETTPLKTSKIRADRIRSMLRQYEEGNRIELYTRDLYRERIEPIEEALDGVENLIVIPSGLMLGIPVEILGRREGEKIGDSYKVSYAPSATIYVKVTEQQHLKTNVGWSSALLVADPPFCEADLEEMKQTTHNTGDCYGQTRNSVDFETLQHLLIGSEEARASLGRLPCTRIEVETIAPLFESNSLLVGVRASEQEIARLARLRELREFKSLHFATHTLLDDRRSDRWDHFALVLSGVDLPDPLNAALTGQRIFDGLLTKEEIVRDWDLDADLVTLSACDTGLGQVVGGEGYVGLASAFLEVGARSLLVSMWPVDDRTTCLLMARFYENWTGKYEDIRHGRNGRPMSKAEALQEAKQFVQAVTNDGGDKTFEHPSYWSAFVLIGSRD